MQRMVGFTKEAAILHLKENWDNVNSSIAFSGISKLHQFYGKVISKKVIKKELSKFESFSLMSETNRYKKM